MQAKVHKQDVSLNHSDLPWRVTSMRSCHYLLVLGQMLGIGSIDMALWWFHIELFNDKVFLCH